MVEVLELGRDYVTDRETTIMATMELDGYVARVDISEDDGTLHGHIMNISDMVTFEGKNVKELRREFRTSLADYFEFCEKTGGKPEKPFSGKFVLRIEPELHGAIAAAAARDEKSINSWAKEKLAAAAGPRSGPLDEVAGR